MFVAGMISHGPGMKTANLISSILSSCGRKLSIMDSKVLTELNLQQLKEYVTELKKNGTDILIVKINILDIKKEIFEYLHFDIMIYTDKADELRGINIDNYKMLMRRIFAMLDEKSIVIVNVDENDLIGFLEGMKYYVVTYGFNSKASITASSTGDTFAKDAFMCCLQRSISAKNGQLVEPQEYRLRVNLNDMDPYNILAAATFAIVYGLDLNTIRDV